MPFRARSLRLKLAGWFVLVFFLIQTTLVGGLVAFRREMIHQSLDSALEKASEAMVDNILVADVEWTRAALDPLVPRGAGFVFYALRDQDGNILATSGVERSERLPFSAWEIVPAGPVGGVHTIVRADRAEELTGKAERLRLVTLPFRYGEQLFFFQAAARDESLARYFGPFFDLVVLGIPAGVVAALVAAWLIAGRAVSPIRRLSRAVRDVSPTNLSERFELPTSDAEVARLEAELNSALERIEAGYRAQDQFLANVSHELKTPIAVLVTQAQVAKLGERSLDKGYAFVERAESLLRRLARTVESLLVLARADLTRGQGGETVSLVDVLLGCVQSCQGAAEQAGVRLVPRIHQDEGDGAELTLVGDADLLQTLTENLVHNAISHSPRGGEVLIEARRAADGLTLEVRDQGPGIPEEYLERVFERFVQVPDGSARRDGTGLGLAIARAIAQLHGGRIEARNHPAGGCSFTVILRESSEASPDPV